MSATASCGYTIKLNFRHLLCQDRLTHTICCNIRRILMLISANCGEVIEMGQASEFENCANFKQLAKDCPIEVRASAVGSGF